MNEPGKVPPRCDFDADKLRLELDEAVSSDINVIDGVVTKIMGLIGETGCDDDLDSIELSLREALANAMIHGNHLDPHEPVRIGVSVQDDCGMLIVVKDSGSGFDPALLPNPCVGQHLLDTHGRGVFIINQLMSDVHFDFHNGTTIYMHRSGRPKPSEPK
jgi:anti-sigma regulatory factor (Ser/Thr protein kinase)